MHNFFMGTIVTSNPFCRSQVADQLDWRITTLSWVACNFKPLNCVLSWLSQRIIIVMGCEWVFGYSRTWLPYFVIVLVGTSGCIIIFRLVNLTATSQHWVRCLWFWASQLRFIWLLQSIIFSWDMSGWLIFFRLVKNLTAILPDFFCRARVADFFVVREWVVLDWLT